MEITIEMGCFKFPTDEMIPRLWKEHKFSLLSFMELVHQSVKGIVTGNYYSLSSYHNNNTFRF